MNKINVSRRSFIKNTTLGAAAIGLGGMALSAKSYGRIIGANDRINVAIIGLGRRLGGFIEPITTKKNNIQLLYLCDVMQRQMDNAAKRFANQLDYKPTLEEDFFKVIADKQLDAIINATPDHWHAPGTWMANEAGKHVYVEKPCSHNPRENELLIKSQELYGKLIQMGNQQRSSGNSIHIINEIHNGIIGDVYLAQAFYANQRGRTPNPTKAPIPEGLNWDLWQGPAPRKEYEHDTWDYNWHWYGWDYGTAETGNNANHEFDIARWALQVDFPEKVIVHADKHHWKDDGWTMYDTMDATLKFQGGKTIKWDGKSRNGHNTYGGGRGTIIYGTEGSVWMNRSSYKQFDRSGKMIEEARGDSNEGDTQLGGGGNITSSHVVNFFEAIRGKEKLKSPIDDAMISTLYCQLSNIAYRTGEVLDCDPKNGRITNSEKAMKLWSREYAPGYEPNF